MENDDEACGFCSAFVRVEFALQSQGLLVGMHTTKTSLSLLASSSFQPLRY